MALVGALRVALLHSSSPTILPHPAPDVTLSRNSHDFVTEPSRTSCYIRHPDCLQGCIARHGCSCED
ncbi:hypothetical protein IG631_09444 [Alternaria alternata]|nr:hypothetical protein IG631_09444 [Alternaria alternata]